MFLYPKAKHPKVSSNAWSERHSLQQQQAVQAWRSRKQQIVVYFVSIHAKATDSFSNRRKEVQTPHLCEIMIHSSTA